MAGGSTFIDGVLRQNGYTVGKPDNEGVRTITRQVSSLRTMKTYVITITDPKEGLPTLTVKRYGDDSIVATKTDVWQEIGSDAVVMTMTLGG